MPIVNISYNSFNLQTTTDPANTILTRDIIHRGLPEKIIAVKEDTIRDSFDVVDSRYSRKMITVRGWLISDSETNLRTLRDNFMRALRPDERNLDIDDGSGTVRYLASVQSIECAEEFWMSTQIPFEITFLAEPFGKSTTSTTLNLNSGVGITTSPYTETINVLGSYKAKPVITFTISAENNLTAIKFENLSTQDWIQVAPSGGFGTDSLVIDCENETVKRNGSAEDFTGVFPSLNPGDNNLKITFTSTSHNVIVGIVFYPTYL